MKLPQLITHISIPDWHPSCEICGFRGELIGYFRHTNFRGDIYECTFCPESYQFIDQEDRFFSVEYWYMSERQRRIFRTLTEGQRKIFLSMPQREQSSFIRLNRLERKIYMAQNYKSSVEEFDNFSNAEFFKYEIYG